MNVQQDALSYDKVDRALERAYSDVRDLTEGQVAQVYPAMAGADPSLFGLCAVDLRGQVWERGDAEAGFGLMSTAKPFTFALVCAAIGAERARDEIGVNATGSEYNDVEPVLAAEGGRTNPMVNAGAIATCSRVPGADAAAQWAHLLDGLSAFAGRQLYVDEALYANVMATNVRNRELADALASKGALATSAADALEIYSKQSCVWTTAHDLAVMGATLANGGVNPITGVRVVPAHVVRPVIAVMMTSGLYEISGEWLYDVALPGKTGLGGGIVTVAPGRLGLGGFSPLLDEAANTVRGARAHAEIAEALGLGLF
ncbi:MAG: glutaminase A [Propionibacteriales bacterium]|nr:glutaminase A [Propionibacteriales bacterium]